MDIKISTLNGKTALKFCFTLALSGSTVQMGLESTKFVAKEYFHDENARITHNNRQRRADLQLTSGKRYEIKYVGSFIETSVTYTHDMKLYAKEYRDEDGIILVTSVLDYSTQSESINSMQELILLVIVIDISHTSAEVALLSSQSTYKKILAEIQVKYPDKKLKAVPDSDILSLITNQTVISLFNDNEQLKMHNELLKTDVGQLKNDVGNLKTDVGQLKNDVGYLKTDMQQQNVLLTEILAILKASVKEQKFTLKI